MRRRIVRDNQRVREVVKLCGQTVRQKIFTAFERRNVINVRGKREVVRLSTRVFVVEKIIFPVGAAEIRINLNDGNFAVNVNQIALRISLRPTKIFSAAVNAAQREIEMHIKIFRVVAD